MSAAAMVIPVLAWLVGCSSTPTSSAAGDADPARLPSIGEPVVTHSALGTLIAQSVGQNIEGEQPVPNPVVLVDPEGEIADLPPLPSDLPLQMVRVAPSGDGFVLIGHRCAPIPDEEDDTSGCAEGGGPPVVFRYDGDKWTSVGPLPKPAETGVIPLEGGDQATFLTGSGSVISYDQADEKWTERKATPADAGNKTAQIPDEAGQTDNDATTQVTAASVELHRTVSVVAIKSTTSPESTIDHFEIRVAPR